MLSQTVEARRGKKAEHTMKARMRIGNLSRPSAGRGESNEGKIVYLLWLRVASDKKRTES
jgi:hypothetical protein